MKGDWVPFHKRLAKGPKKSIPRGIRFVLLELSLEARATQGVIDLPLDWDTLDAVHDLLGGDRREIRKALQIFSLRDSTGVGAIEIIKDASRHRIVITKWEEWAGPKTSTERVRVHRDNKRLEKNETLHGVSPETPETLYITGQDKTGQDNPQTPKGAAGDYPGILAIAIRGYAAGIRAITKQNWAFPDKPDERRALTDIVLLKAQGNKGDSLEAKMTAVASSYCQANRDRGQFEGGFRPTKCLEWINSGADVVSGTHRIVGDRRAARTAAVQLADLARAEGDKR